MTSKIKISMSHTSNSGVSESKKLLASYTSKAAILTSKKQSHTRKNENVAHSISERKSSENRN